MVMSRPSRARGLKPRQRRRRGGDRRSRPSRARGLKLSVDEARHHVEVTPLAESFGIADCLRNGVL